MADETNERAGHTCTNAPCSCPVEKKNEYCGVSCQSTGQTTQIDCDCGHPDCKGDF